MSSIPHGSSRGIRSPDEETNACGQEIRIGFVAVFHKKNDGNFARNQNVFTCDACRQTTQCYSWISSLFQRMGQFRVNPVSTKKAEGYSLHSPFLR